MPVPCVQYFLRTGRLGIGCGKKQWAALVAAHKNLQWRWRAEQNKRQGIFAFSGNNLGFVLWGLFNVPKVPCLCDGPVISLFGSFPLGRLPGNCIFQKP